MGKQENLVVKDTSLGLKRLGSFLSFTTELLYDGGQEIQSLIYNL